PDYEITVKWDIGEASYASDNRIHFFAAASDAEKTYIVSEKKLFSVGDGRIREVLRLGGRESFRIGPVAAGNYICAISTQQIYLVDRGRLTVESSIPMEKDGIVDDNYYPVSREGVLYIPVSNYGYYILDTSSPRPSPVKLYAELFPLSPVINGGGLFVGSFYGNYVASLDEKGNVRWKHAIGGNSYSNMTLSGGALYIYVLENGRPSVVSINADGKKTGQWILDGRMVTDLVSYNGSLFGLYTDGGLFRLDTASMRPETIATVFSAALSSKAQRNLRPLVHEGILYIGTDSGELLIYDIEDRAVKDNVAVGDGTAFYTPPFFCEGGVCLVSNGGRVYSIVKTGR
ncbi:MAG: PQQ-binding-like beta-propeller repeat protein, partial [Spirochaetales bacterium]|nr:PQQ-binding-like beta-propeller repeat protein [Spirochaetales bacterium]